MHLLWKHVAWTCRSACCVSLYAGALNTWFASVLGAETFHADVHAGVQHGTCLRIIASNMMLAASMQQPTNSTTACKCCSPCVCLAHIAGRILLHDVHLHNAGLHCRHTSISSYIEDTSAIGVLPSLQLVLTLHPLPACLPACLRQPACAARWPCGLH